MPKDQPKSSKILSITGIIVLGIVGVSSYLYSKPLAEERAKLESQRHDLALEVAAERAKINELNNNCYRFENDPEFVERIARKNHRVLPGETEFIFDAPE